MTEKDYIKEENIALRAIIALLTNGNGHGHISDDKQHIHSTAGRVHAKARKVRINRRFGGD